MRIYDGRIQVDAAPEYGGFILIDEDAHRAKITFEEMADIVEAYHTYIRRSSDYEDGLDDTTPEDSLVTPEETRRAILEVMRRIAREEIDSAQKDQNDVPAAARRFKEALLKEMPDAEVWLAPLDGVLGGDVVVVLPTWHPMSAQRVQQIGDLVASENPMILTIATFYTDMMNSGYKDYLRGHYRKL